MTNSGKIQVIIHSDGGSRGNPGPAAIGAVVEVKNGGATGEAGKTGQTSRNQSSQTNDLFGAVAPAGNGRVYEISEYLGDATNNQAEYQAIVKALEKAKQVVGKKNLKAAEVSCFLDSELIVKQLNRQYKIKEESLFKPFITLWNLTLEFGNVTFHHVRREQNKKADALVNQALDRQLN